MYHYPGYHSQAIPPPRWTVPNPPPNGIPTYALNASPYSPAQVQQTQFYQAPPISLAIPTASCTLPHPFMLPAYNYSTTSTCPAPIAGYSSWGHGSPQVQDGFIISPIFPSQARPKSSPPASHTWLHHDPRRTERAAPRHRHHPKVPPNTGNNPGPSWQPGRTARASPASLQYGRSSLSLVHTGALGASGFEATEPSVYAPYNITLAPILERDSRDVAGPSSVYTQRWQAPPQRAPRRHSLATDYAVACQLQRRFDEEDRTLAQERAALQREGHEELTSECKICFEQRPIVDIVDVSGCGHTFCRTCLQDYVSTKVQEKVYPIVCPVCAAEKLGGEHAVLGREFLRRSRISESLLGRFSELELSVLFVLQSCPRCRTSYHLRRRDMVNVGTLQCTTAGCRAIWCGKCNLLIDGDSTAHSCNGTRELDQLVAMRGWRKCPGCSTPIEKIEGCNHLKCIAPGCNTHFCYSCGETITRSTTSNVNDAIREHYSTCTLIDELEVQNPPMIPVVAMAPPWPHRYH